MRVAIRGFSINISDKISSRQATYFAQWIGAANVMRNQKRCEYVTLLAENKGDQINQAYTSKTCHVCQGRGTIRANQATLICLNGCGTFNADENAAKVIAQRAVSYIYEAKFADKAKPRKKTAIRKKKKAVSPPLGEELSSVKKSGKLAAAPSGVPLAS